MPVLLMINLKGGVGKTASTVALAETMAECGQRVLVIDADHQSMAGELLAGQSRMLRAERSRTTLHDLFLAMADVDFDPKLLNKFVIGNASTVGSAMSNLWTIPCSFRIDDFFSSVAKSNRICRTYATERELQVGLGKRMPKVKKWLMQHFDYVLVDCPPSIAMQVKMFLRIADGYIIPSIPDQLSVRGSENLVKRIGKLNFKVPGIGTLWTLYRQQVALHREIVKEPFAKLPTPFETVIPNATKLASAMTLNDAKMIPNCDIKYGNEFASRYGVLTDELISHCNARFVMPAKSMVASELVGAM
ncbi:ParA family protein [Neorhodopirellula lusitana]|uniref:ParA family protein n=1 Tax=Neorhodopirellula lusitana TaxID=445327 RepID=UPI003850CCEB